MTKYVSLFIFSLFVFSVNCFSQNASEKNVRCKTFASFTPYHTAFGKGKGVVFRVTISVKKNKSFSIDSFFVNNKPLKFSIKQNKEGLNIESNYFVNSPEPTLNNDGTTYPPKEIEDELISHNHFYPSWIVFTVNGKKMKVKIHKYKLIPEKEHS